MCRAYDVRQETENEQLGNINNDIPILFQIRGILHVYKSY